MHSLQVYHVMNQKLFFVPLHQVQCLPSRLVMAASLETSGAPNPLVGCWTDPVGDMWVNLFIANRNVVYVNSKKETGYKVTSVYNGQLWCKTIINAPVTGSYNRTPSFEKYLNQVRDSGQPRDCQ